ncbi:hypothetical protein Hanom_Chr14g01246941 [Helianthus anomalus]
MTFNSWFYICAFEVFGLAAGRSLVGFWFRGCCWAREAFGQAIVFWLLCWKIRV